MGDLTKNLSRWEFACICGCGKDTVDFELVTVLQSFVDSWLDHNQYKAVRIHINSGTRCFRHNDEIGGVWGSRHQLGKAADFTMEVLTHTGEWLDVEPEYVYMELDSRYPNKYGIGCYEDFTHLDVRSKKARW